MHQKNSYGTSDTQLYTYAVGLTQSWVSGSLLSLYGWELTERNVDNRGSH